MIDLPIKIYFSFSFPVLCCSSVSDPRTGGQVRKSDDPTTVRWQRGRVLPQGVPSRVSSAEIGFDEFHLEELRSSQGHRRMGRPQEELEVVRRSRADPRPRHEDLKRIPNLYSNSDEISIALYVLSQKVYFVIFCTFVLISKCLVKLPKCFVVKIVSYSQVFHLL